jgi:hypothetical protein
MDMLMSIDLDTPICREPDPLAGEIDQEVVLFSAQQGAYFQLNGVAGRVWALLETETTPAAIIDQLVEEFEVSQPVCEAEVLEFLRDLLREGLVRAGR